MEKTQEELMEENQRPVPSELLEYPLTKITAILFHQYVQSKCSNQAFNILAGQVYALGMFISALKATHCNLAFTHEVQSMIWAAEKDPKEKKLMDEHFKTVYRKQMGLPDLKKRKKKSTSENGATLSEEKE